MINKQFEENEANMTMNDRENPSYFLAVPMQDLCTICEIAKYCHANSILLSEESKENHKMKIALYFLLMRALRLWDNIIEYSEASGNIDDEYREREMLDKINCAVKREIELALENQGTIDGFAFTLENYKQGYSNLCSNR